MVRALAREFHALDKQVVDVEEPAFRPTPFEHEVTLEAVPPIARPRVETKDLAVHVNVDGFWHRLHPSTVKTACDYPVNFVRSATRNGRHPDHPLATHRPDGEPCDCWTRAERAEADAEYRRKFGRDFVP